MPDKLQVDPAVERLAAKLRRRFRIKTESELLFKALQIIISEEHQLTRDAVTRRLDTIQAMVELIARELAQRAEGDK